MAVEIFDKDQFIYVKDTTTATNSVSIHKSNVITIVRNTTDLNAIDLVYQDENNTKRFINIVYTDVSIPVVSSTETLHEALNNMFSGSSDFFFEVLKSLENISYNNTKALSYLSIEVELTNKLLQKVYNPE